jgi:hypothetical protein
LANPKLLMLNQPPNYSISILIDNAESPPKLWPCIPHIGEAVESENGAKYRIVDVVHGFARPTTQITLVLEKAT